AGAGAEGAGAAGAAEGARQAAALAALDQDQQHHEQADQDQQDGQRDDRPGRHGEFLSDEGGQSRAALNRHYRKSRRAGKADQSPQRERGLNKPSLTLRALSKRSPASRWPGTSRP